MARVVRKQITMSERDARLLERTAAGLHIAQSEVVRLAVRTLSPGAVAASGGEAAWASELRFIRKRGRMKVPPTARRWTREELHAERLRSSSR